MTTAYSRFLVYWVRHFEIKLNQMIETIPKYQFEKRQVWQTNKKHVITEIENINPIVYSSQHSLTLHRLDIGNKEG